MRPWRLLILVAFLAGLVLPIWWLAKGSSGNLPGLWVYPSAYIGDTILLPTGCTVLLIGIRKLPPAQGEAVIAVAGVAVAVAAAIVVQTAWLRDPRPRLNWTLPQPGHFDAAGWWHAVYFTAMSGLVVGLTTIFLLRVRHGRRAGDVNVREVSAGTGGAVVLIAFGSYAALAVHDNSPGPITRASASSLALTGAATVVAVVLIAVAYGRSSAILIRPTLVAVGGVAVIATFAATPLHSQTFQNAAAVAAVSMGAAIGVDSYLVRTARDDTGKRRGWGLLSIAVAVGVVIAAWTRLSAPLAEHAPAKIAIIAVVSVLLVLSVLFGVLGRDATAVLPVTLVGIMVISVAAAAIWFDHMPLQSLSGSNALLNTVRLVTILAGLAIGLSSVVVKARTDGVLGVPVDVTAVPGSRLAPDMFRPASAALALVALFAVGGFLATLAFVLAVNRGLPFPTHTSPAVSDIRLMCIGALVILLSAAVLFANEQVHTNRLGRVGVVVIRIMAPVVLSILLLLDISRPHVSLLVILEAVGVGLLMFLWTFNSVANNVWLMQGRSMGVGAVGGAFSLSLLSGTTGAWVLIGGISSGGHTRSPWQAVTIALTALLVTEGIVVLLGGAYKDSLHLPHYTEFPVWRGLLQDALSCSAITLILIFPVIYLWTIIGFWGGLFVALPVITFFATPFMWIMKANREHPKVETLRLIKPRSKAKKLLTEMQERSERRLIHDQLALVKAMKQPCAPKSAAFIRILAAHTRNQNRIAAAMIVIPVAGALQLLFGLVTDNTWLPRHLTQLAWPATVREAIHQESRKQNDITNKGS